MSLERSVLAGALTLSLVILPVVILTAQEALRAVPVSLRHASYALGATRWQTIWHQVLPVASPGILTGVILAVSRALGEAAPLVAVGAVAYVSFVPSRLSDAYTALPIQIFDWSQRPQREFHDLAAAAIIVLLVVLLCMNGVAVYLRQRYGKQMRW
jgi:phosphate transport system permease protein